VENLATAAVTAAIAADGIGKRYGDRDALRSVSFSAVPGELLAVIGPNGAGKTTLLSILAGITSSSAGAVRRPDGARAGWVPQQVAVYSKLTVAENLRLFARLEGVSDVSAAVDRMLDQADLRDRADDELENLSGGNRQRVNVAVGLVAAPSVLLLDEPSASLDPRQRARLWEFIGGLAERGTTVIFSTHDVAEAERYADRLLVLADGELLFEGTTAALREAVGGGDADFERAFVEFLRERGH
jgi:ABC-2 type transport system ATP-binding protein